MSIPSPSLSIVLVEDQDDIRLVLALILRKKGFTVFDFASGHDGLARIRDTMPSIAVIDSGLPDIRGIDVGRKIRSLPGGENVVLALFTGTDSESIRQELSTVPFDLYFTKPVGMNELCDSLFQCAQSKVQGPA